MGNVYKLITKVLARKMARVMEKVMGEYQHAFVGARQILDAALLADEIVDELKHKNLERVLCKLDMEKTYDHVDWEFLNYMLNMIGFGDK